jgi:hypothetical protein
VQLAVHGAAGALDLDLARGGREEVVLQRPHLRSRLCRARRPRIQSRSSFFFSFRTTQRNRHRTDGRIERTKKARIGVAPFRLILARSICSSNPFRFSPSFPRIGGRNKRNGIG